MAQLFLKDSGILIDEGLTESQYQDRDDWDPAFWSTSDTGQTFKPFEYDQTTGKASGRVPEREVWFFVPSENLFFQSLPGEHSILAAAKTVFTANRWNEIRDALDEHCNLGDLLNRLDISALKRKAARAVAAGKISTAELDRLKSVVQHLDS